MKSITLINPPSPWLMSDTVYLPLGILYLASYLIKKKFNVKFIDLCGGIKQYTIPKTDYYGIGFVTPQVDIVKQIIKKIKTKYPNAKLIAGGVHATSLPEKTLLYGFDCVVRGESEKSMFSILNQGIQKQVYQFDYITLLDELPFPAWHLINMKQYTTNLDVTKYLVSGYEQERQTSVMATRGCPYSCKYCTQYKGKCRRRGVENVLSELVQLKTRYGINRVRFVDDNFTMSKEWVLAMCPKINKTGIKWSCLGRADNPHHEIYRVMQQNGCMGIDFGIESGSQMILDKVGKMTYVWKQEEGIREAHKAGLKVRAQMMLGLPYETDETIKETIRFIKRNNKCVSRWGIHTFIPFPSCEIFHNPSKFNYTIDLDYTKYQTVGKKNIWAYTPPDYKNKIDGWRKEVINAIGDKDIQK